MINFNIDDLTIRETIDRLFPDTTIVPRFNGCAVEIQGNTPYPGTIITDCEHFLSWADFIELPMAMVKKISSRWNSTEIVFEMDPDFEEIATGDYNALYEE